MDDSYSGRTSMNLNQKGKIMKEIWFLNVVVVAVEDEAASGNIQNMEKQMAMSQLVIRNKRRNELFSLIRGKHVLQRDKRRFMVSVRWFRPDTNVVIVGVMLHLHECLF